MLYNVNHSAMSCQDSGYDNEIPQVIAGRYEVKVEKQIADTNAGKLLRWNLTRV